MKNLFKRAITAILTAEARAIIRKYRPRIIAVTGSVGKTSTKDALYAALSPHASARKSEKSFNSEIGIPLTIIGCPNAWNNPLRWLENIIDGLTLIIFRSSYPSWLILEVGADRPGDIRRVARWLPVDIAVITRLPEVPVHVEYFDSADEVTEEKAAILSALNSAGSLILYADDERSANLAARAEKGVRVLSFGFSERADVRGKQPSIRYSDDSGRPQPTGMEMDIDARGETVRARIAGSVGEHALLPLLAAAAAGSALGIPLRNIIDAFEKNFTPPPGRMRLIQGIKDSTLIDDTYNASPAAVTAALETLHSLRATGRTIAVLGDMLELGRHSVEEHRKVGALAAESADTLITVGFRARDMAAAALDAGLHESHILQYEASEKAGEELLPQIKPGDIVLIKGSQSMRMERTVKALMRDPRDAERVLVRQEKEWLER